MNPVRRRRTMQVTLFVLFVVLPLLELYVLVQVGQVIGAGWTILLLLLAAVAGSWAIRHEGSRTWRAMGEAMSSGRMPTTEIADGALILLGGALMVAPGFITDALGLLLVLPVTRPVFRRLLAVAVGRRLAVDVIDLGPEGRRGPGGAAGPADPGRRSPGPGPASGPVVQGEVVDDDD